jgi:hypothetical protein
MSAGFVNECFACFGMNSKQNKFLFYKLMFSHMLLCLAEFDHNLAISRPDGKKRPGSGWVSQIRHDILMLGIERLEVKDVGD